MGERRATAASARQERPTPIAGQARTEQPVVVRRVGESAWILRPTRALEDHAIEALRDAFLEAVDSGAENLVVDLSDVETIAPRGAETILAMADLVRGRSGTFWLAARSSDGEAHTLRVVDEDGRTALLGMSAPLDAALERLPAGRTNTVTARERSSESFTQR